MFPDLVVRPWDTPMLIQIMLTYCLADVRNLVAYYRFTQHDGFQTIFDDIIPPPDLEQEIESQVETSATESENIKALAEFPQDDIDVS